MEDVHTFGAGSAEEMDFGGRASDARRRCKGTWVLRVPAHRPKKDRLPEGAGERATEGLGASAEIDGPPSARSR
jgi:hypothetical protein